jgi:hypothetical protein
MRALTRCMVIVVAVVAGVSVPARARAQPPENTPGSIDPTLGALVGEVRGIRVWLDRVGSQNLRVLLLTQQLTIADSRRTRTALDLTDAQDAIKRLQFEVSLATRHLTDLESTLANETDPAGRRDLARERRALLREREGFAFGLQQQQGRLSDLMAAARTAEQEWRRLQERVTEVDRSLSTSQR